MSPLPNTLIMNDVLDDRDTYKSEYNRNWGKWKLSLEKGP